MAETLLQHPVFPVTLSLSASRFDAARQAMLRAWRDYAAEHPDVASEEILATRTAMEGILAFVEARV